MKNLALMAITIFSLSTNAIATCIDAYEVYTVKNERDNDGKETGRKVITSGSASLGSGGLVYLTGYALQGAFGSQAAWMTIFYSGSSITTAPVISLSGTITYLMALEYIKIQKTLKQSRYGFGAEIDTLKEDIEDSIGREISKKELMNAINVADQNKEFCTDRLSKRDEIKDYLVDLLR